MTVKIVTDSSSDLPLKVVKELGITVVPLWVRFGNKSFRDGVDIDPDTFYNMLTKSGDMPVTAAPSPGAFAEAYGSLAKETQEIVSIHISSKLSGTRDSAQAGKGEVKAKCRIEVIDSTQVTMALGLITIAAAKAARAGATVDEIVKLVNSSASNVFLAGLLDSLKYLEKGGRIGKAQAWLGSMLNIKPILSVIGGEVVPFERVRTRSKGVERLYQLADEHLPAKEVSVFYSTGAAEAEKLLEHLKKAAPGQEVYLARFGAVLGTYVGPDSIGIATLK